MARMSRSGMVMVAVLGMGGTAWAQGERCGAVRLVRVPEDVAAVIERHLGTRCGRGLEVWVARTEGGLYLVARDALGRVRERVVPDAEVAAALIASWVQLDEAVAVPATPVPTPAFAAPDAPTVAPAATSILTTHTTLSNAPAATTAAPTTAAPATTAPTAPATTTATASPTATPAAARTFAIGARLGVTWDRDNATAANVEVEVMHRGALFAALELLAVQETAVSYYVVEPELITMTRTAELGRSGVDAMARAGAHVGTRIYVRPSLAVGAGGSRHELLRTTPDPVDAPQTTTSTTWTFGVRLGVALAAGVQLGPYAIELTLADVASLQRPQPGISGDDRALSAGLGLRFRR